MIFLSKSPSGDLGAERPTRHPNPQDIKRKSNLYVEE